MRFFKKRGLMLKYIFPLIFLFLFSPILNATQPEGGWKPDITVEGNPVTVYWEGLNNRPKMLIWAQNRHSESFAPYYVTSEKGMITIDRKGLNAIPHKLLVVPEISKFKPRILEIEPESREVFISFEPIPQNEVWFWGLTPPNPCSHLGGSVSVSVRLIHKKYIYEDFNGPFV